ncbi:hypothetical protein MN869_07285, partial [Acinetobacter sp. NIPH1876]|nr:hypothetical protein [Acinetobacter sp. NIPH1876]
GRTLNSGQRDQLFQLLSTEDDVVALAAAIQQKLDTEKNQRQAADIVLQGNINTEAATRANAVNNESNARTNADNALSVRLKALEDLPPPLGVNQTWVDVKSSRVAGTVYTNPYNRPIAVNITVKVYHDSSPAQLLIDSKVHAQVNCDVGPNGYVVSPMYTVIPAGAKYKLSNADAILFWEELKQAD